jgi:hypothetical protein
VNNVRKRLWIYAAGTEEKQTSTKITSLSINLLALEFYI